MSDPAWYSNWRHDAVHQLQQKNAVLVEDFRIGSWPRYDYDLESRTLTFSEDGHAKVIAEIQVVGTTSENAGNWLWAWDNAHWPSDTVVDALKVRDFGDQHQIAELTKNYVEDDDLNALGWELTAVAARVCDAVGAYRPPRDEGGGFFLLYRSVYWAT
ncbi:MAG: DUF6882 domain-containing protein [Sphingomonadales bacterium]